MQHDTLSDYPGVTGFDFNGDAVSKRPEHAKLMMEVINRWAHIDQKLTTLVADFLDAEYVVAYAMLEAISNADTRRKAIEAAARVRLPREDAILVQATMSHIDSKREARNIFAHWLIGSSDELDDCVLAVHPRFINRFHIEGSVWGDAIAAMIEGSDVPAPEVQAIPRDEIYVFRTDDLHTAVVESFSATVVLASLIAAINRRSKVVRPLGKASLLANEDVKRRYDRLIGRVSE